MARTSSLVLALANQRAGPPTPSVQNDSSGTCSRRTKGRLRETTEPRFLIAKGRDRLGSCAASELHPVTRSKLSRQRKICSDDSRYLRIAAGRSVDRS